MVASFNGYLEVAKLLIDSGVDVDAKDNIGGTALMFVSVYGNPEIVKLLKEAGATY